MQCSANRRAYKWFYVDIPKGKQHSDDPVADGRIKINIQMCTDVSDHTQLDIL